ncbi:hypothetical protein [Saccharomonospora iraqiensis]|uniref:hypothetical protein n=1 Tax=Saccharomonospora iraqiensis TaxID=52698 RepID=UPI00022E0E55|nr:hypothetical protein [Saccharomonospora iraqiensis]
MRTVGIGALGIIGGLLLAITLQDILAHALADTEGTPSTVGRILGSLKPALGLLGAVLAVRLDRRHHRTRPGGRGED